MDIVVLVETMHIVGYSIGESIEESIGRELVGDSSNFETKRDSLLEGREGLKYKEFDFSIFDCKVLVVRNEMFGRVLIEIPDLKKAIG